MTVKRKTLAPYGEPHFQLHTGEEYFNVLSNDIATVDEELVSVASMGFDPTDPHVIQVLEALRNASHRGAAVSLTVDHFSYFDKSGIGPIGEVPLGDYGYLDSFAESGQQLFAGLSNKPNIAGFHTLAGWTYAGRSHIKSATVGDNLYVGGISLDATDRLDAMVQVTHPELAYQVAVLNRSTIIRPSVAHVLDGADYAITFDEAARSELLVDAGIRGQSIIFDEATDIIESAEERLIYASEQFPTGKAGHLLLNAYERGVDVTIASNHPSKHDRYTLAHAAILAVAKKKYPASFFDNQLPQYFPGLHTKALASESRAMIGSHNLNRIGVRLGTAEMSIVSSNKEFVSQVGSLILRQISHGVNA